MLVRNSIPVIVLAFGSAVALNRIGGIDQWWSQIPAHAAGGLPFVVWNVRAAFQSVDDEMLAAARDLGAKPLQRGILALRAVGDSVVAGGLLAFLFSLDEFALTFLIAGIDIVTLPVLLYDALQRSSVQAASAIAVILLVPSGVIAVLAAKLMRRAENMMMGGSA